MNKGKVRGRIRATIAAVLVVLFLPLVGALTDAGQGVAYGQAGEQALERYNSAECVKLRRELADADRELRTTKEMKDDEEYTFEKQYEGALRALVAIRILRDQIAGLDAAEVFLPVGETRVRGLLQEMRKKAEARLKEQTDRFEMWRQELINTMSWYDTWVARIKQEERKLKDVQDRLSAAGCDLQPGNLVSSLPPPSALGAPMPPTRPPGPTPPPPTPPPPPTTALELTITLGGATQTRNLRTDTLAHPVHSPATIAHLQSGQTYVGNVTVTGTLPAGYTVYVFHHSQVWAVLNPTGGDFSVGEAKGFGAANDVSAHVCQTGAKKGDGYMPPPCLKAETNIEIYWRP